MLDFPASGQALWDLFDQTGIRPEYSIICMMRESGLNPAARNPGSGCTGLNQVCWAVAGDYASWPASRQIKQVVAPFWISLFKQYGPINSGVKLEAGNMYPASLKSAHYPWSVVIDSKTDPGSWAGNANLFDPKRTGKIRIQGIADSMRPLVDDQLVIDSIAQTYALRPAEIPLEPVFGSDFVYEGGVMSALDLVFDSFREAGATLIGKVRS